MNKRLISLLLVLSIILSSFAVFATENTNYNAIESNSKVTKKVQVEEQVDDEHLDENTETDINSDLSLKEETTVDFNSNSIEIVDVEELTEQEIIDDDIVALETNLDESTEESNDIKIDDDAKSTVTDINENSVMGTKFNMDQYNLQDSEIENARANIGEENPAEKPTIDSISAETPDISPNIEIDADTELETEVDEDIINTEEFVIDDSVSEDTLLKEDVLESSTEDNTLVSKETEYDQTLIEYLNNNENFNAVDTSTEAENLSNPEYQISTYATTADEKMKVEVVNNPYFGDVVNGAAVSLSTGALAYEKTLISLPGRNDFNVDLTVQYNSDAAVVGEDSYASLAYESVKSHNEFATGWSFAMTHLTKTRGRYGYSYTNPVLTLRDGSSYEVEYINFNSSTYTSDVKLKEYELNDLRATVTYNPTTYEEEQIIIEYSDGVKEYIDEETGDLIKSEDRFGNVITYGYTDLNYYRMSLQDINAGYTKNNPPVGYNINLHTLNKITDSTGKEINIDYAVTEGNMGIEIDNIKVSVDDTVYATLDLKNINENNNMYILESITDGENLTTTFEYDKQLSHSYVYQNDNYRVNGTNVLLTKVNYPTGGYTDYEYLYARRSLDTSANARSLNWYEVYKVSNITDSDGNSTMYEYNVDISGYPINYPVEVLGGSTENYQTIEHKRVDDDSLTTTIYTFYQKNLLREDVYDSAESSSTFISSPGNYDGSVIIDGAIYRILISDNALIIYKNDEQSDTKLESIHNLGYTVANNAHLYYLNVKTSGNKIIIFLKDTSVSPNNTKVKVYDIVEKTWTDGNSTAGTSTEYYAAGDYIYRYSNNTITYYDVTNGHWYDDTAFGQHLCNDGTDKVYFMYGNKLYVYSFYYGTTELVSDRTFNGTYTKGFYKNNTMYLLNSSGIYVYDTLYDTLSSIKAYPSDVTFTSTSFMGTDGNVYMVGEKLSDGSQRIYYFSDNFYVHSYRLMDYRYDDKILIGNNAIYIGCEMISLDKTTHLRNRIVNTYNDNDQLETSQHQTYYEGELIDKGTESWTYVNGYSAPLTYTDTMGNVTTYEYLTSTDDNIANLTYLYPVKVTAYSNTDSPIVTTNTRSADNKKIVSASTDYGDSVDTIEYRYDTVYPGNVVETVSYTTKNDVTEETGRITYIYGNEANNNNAYVASSTTYNTTNKADFSGMTVQNQTVYYEYTNLGQLAKEYNYIGDTEYSTSYTYNNNGVLTKVVYPDNTFVEYTYTFGDENKLVTSYNGEYYTVEYYDELGRCIHTGESADGKNLINTVTYGYKNGNVSYSYNSDGLYTYYYYDGYGRVVRIIKTDNPTDGEYNILYDENAVYNEGDMSVNYIIYNKSTNVEHQEKYDVYGRLTEEYRENDYNDPIYTTYEYDNRNNLTKVTGTENSTYTYNNRNQLVSTTDKYGNSVVYEYDNKGNTIKVTTGVNTANNVAGTSVTYTFDTLNRVLSETNQLGKAEYYAYDSHNNMIASKDRKGVVTTYTYDMMDRVLDTRASETEFITYTYDNLGNVLTMTDLTGTTEYVYNEYKSLTEIQNPDESKISYSYDNSKKLKGVLDYDGENVIYTHDLMGNVASVSNEETTLATYTYNTLNRLSTVTHPNQGTTRYYYDPMGNISYMDSKSEDGTVINQYTYYSCDVGLTSEVWGFENGNTIGKFYYYDYNKRLISEDDWANGKETVYTYDANNNMTSKEVYSDTSTINTSYTYNNANQLLTETETATGDTPYTKTTSYSYDNNGNMVGKTVILDSVVIEDYTYGFDAFNRLESIYATHYISDDTAEIYEYKYTYNGNNELSTVSTYTYDGDLISVKKYYWDRGYIIKDVTTTADGVQTKTVTVKHSDVEPVKVASFTEEQPVVETYSLPVNGITCTETINGNNVQISGQIPDANTKNQVALVVSTDVNNVNENNIVHIDQKTSTTGGNFNFNFTLPQNPADVNYGYIIGTDADVDSYIGTISEGQTDDEEPTTPARTVTCTQTVDGNNVKISGQISDANSKNQVSLVVSTDVNNVNENNIAYIDQTVSTTKGKFNFTFTLPQNSGVSSYGYIIGTDADTETYIGVINIQQGGNEDDDDDDNDNDHEGDTDITGTTVTVKYYLGADGVFAQTDTDGTSYLLKNGHGDTVTIVRNGNVVDDAEYDAYGNVENPQNITAYTYANYYYDSHSGMYYLRNRFYDPSIARFISEDPIQDGINWYAYCSNDPINRIDPLGLDSYVIYDPSEPFMINQAKDEQKKLEKKFKTPVYLLEAKNEEEFKNQWEWIGTEDINGNPVTIDGVVIIAHGNPNAIYFSGDKISTYDVSNLSSKTGKELNISSCNAGHLDVSNNIATQFVKNNNFDSTIAWDGTITYSFGKDRLHWNQKSFKKYASNETTTIYDIHGSFNITTKRDAVGMLRYSKDSNGNIIIKDKNNKLISQK